MRKESEPRRLAYVFVFSRASLSRSSPPKGVGVPVFGAAPDSTRRYVESDRRLPAGRGSEGMRSMPRNKCEQFLRASDFSPR